MTLEHDIVHLKHDLASLAARSKRKSSEVSEQLKIALEALECDRPHVAIEKIEYAMSMLTKIGE